MPKVEEQMHDVSLVESPDMMLPYAKIPAASEDYNPGSILSRMIDGLGFRYHWVSEGLREEDLAYRPTPEATSCFETLEHIHGLSNTIFNVATKQANI